MDEDEPSGFKIGESDITQGEEDTSNRLRAIFPFNLLDLVNNQDFVAFLIPHGVAYVYFFALAQKPLWLALVLPVVVLLFDVLDMLSDFDLYRRTQVVSLSRNILLLASRLALIMIVLAPIALSAVYTHHSVHAHIRP